MRTYVYPYKMGSESARALATSLNAVRIRPDGRYTPRSGDFIVNWGNSTTPVFWEALRGLQSLRFLNAPAAVADAANKLRALRILRQAGVSVPDFTTDPNDAAGWIRQGHRVYARHRLTGHSGAGIEILTPHPTVRTTLVTRAPLYVKAVRNFAEYRVHVVDGEVVEYVKKRRRNEDHATAEQNDIRNLDNGWIYSRNNLTRLDRIEEIAVNAVEALGLDFGAVDIIMQEEEVDGQRPVHVLEVNTACGMSESTQAAYLDVFNRLIEDHAATIN